jgi:integrase-like protein
MHAAGDDAEGVRLRGLVVVLWRAGLRISEALALAESDLDANRGAILVRHGKGGKRREVGMDRWAWDQLAPWIALRGGLPVGALFCILRGPTRGRPWAPAGVRTQLHAAGALDDLPIGVLADDLAASELEQVTTTNRNRLPLRRCPGQEPLRPAALSGYPMAVVAVVDIGNTSKPASKPLPNLVPPLEPSSPWFRSTRHLQDAVIREEAHHRANVVRIESIQEALEGLNRYPRLLGYGADPLTRRPTQTSQPTRRPPLPPRSSRGSWRVASPLALLGGALAQAEHSLSCPDVQYVISSSTSVIDGPNIGRNRSKTPAPWSRLSTAFASSAEEYSTAK